MATYDGSVRIKADIENGDLKTLLKDFDELIEKIDDCKQSLSKVEATAKGGKSSKIWKMKKAELEEYESLLNEVKTKVHEANWVDGDKTQSGFGAIEKSSKKCFKAVQGGTKKTNGLLATMSSRLKGIALSLLVFNWITKGFNAMVNAMKEGFRNLAQYSDDYNDSMSALKSQTEQLKNGLAAAFEPVANMIIPYLTQMVSWLNMATDAMAQFLAALQGKNTYTRAKKQVVDYAKSLGTASKAAKGALASFDDLNVLNQNDSGGASASGELVGAEAFETAEVESRISAFAKRIQEAMQPIKDMFVNWASDLDFTPLLNSLEKLQKACDPFLGYIYDGMIWFLEHVLFPLGSWTINEALPLFIDMLAEGMSSLNEILIALRPTFDYIWNNILIPLGEFTGEVLLWAIDMIKKAMRGLADVFVKHGDSINTILIAIGKFFKYLWNDEIKPVIRFIMDALKTVLDFVINIVGDIIDILAGIIDFIVGIFTADWERAWKGLVNIVKGIWNGLISIIEGVINIIIDGLNTIHIDVPSWLEKITGMSSWGFNIEHKSLPRLAEGAVIQGGKPFAAILGDQRYGQTNIETPLSTMIEAFKQAMSEMGANSGGGYNGPVYLQIDGKTFAKLEFPYLQREQRRIGATLKVT